MLSALDLARRIEAGELRPRAVLDLCAQAIAEREGEIGAFATLGIEAARHAADEATLPKLPLRGLPVGIKDIFDTADFPDRLRLLDLCRPSTEGGRRDGVAGPARRRHRRRARP